MYKTYTRRSTRPPHFFHSIPSLSSFLPHSHWHISFMFLLLLFTQSYKRYNFPTIWLTKTLKFDSIFCWWGCGQTGTPHTLLGGIYTGTDLMERILTIPSKNHMYLHFDPAIPLQVINVENTKSTSAQGCLWQHCLWF